MSKLEIKVAEFLEKNVFLLMVIAGTVLALVLRFAAYSYIGSDMEGYLLGWYAQIENLGGMRALNVQVGNYSVIYQTLIALMTYIPVNAVWQYKSLSVLFDFILAIAVGRMVMELSGSKIKGYVAYLLVLFSPLTFMNSAVWGQCDAIYTSFIIMALCAFIKEKYPASFIFYGVACAFKLQAAFMLPFFLFAYVRKKKFSALNFVIIPVVMEVLCIPAMIMGRGIKAAFSVYYYQTFSCDKMFFNYPSFWTIVSDNIENVADFVMYRQTMRTVAIVLTVAVLMLLMGYLLYKKVEVSGINVAYISFIFVFTCVMFLPGMHERYGFVYEILALLIAFFIPKTIPLLTVMYSLTAITYGQCLFGGPDVTRTMGVINLLLYVAYVMVLFRKMTEGQETSEGTIFVAES